MSKVVEKAGVLRTTTNISSVNNGQKSMFATGKSMFSGGKSMFGPGFGMKND